jgi:signal transduction histidine kinase
MRSARSRSTLGFLRRLEVRLVLALASVALVALTVSGIALFGILPSYFVDQAHARLVAAADATASLIKDAPPDRLSPREVREGVLRGIAERAANDIAQATVEFINVQDGSHAALPASPERPAELADQGLRPDPQVQPVETSLTIQVPQLDSVAPDGHLKLRVVISNPYTSRAATLDQVRGTLVAAGALALAGSLLVGLLVSRRLTTPINRLRRVSGRLARGDLDQRAPPSSVVEIDQLATQFNVMADRLSESLRMLQADRDRLREFVADVSHELRTPIAALRTFTDLQREGTLGDATRAEFLDRSSEQLHRLEWLSTNLLDLSRIDSGIFPLDMHEGDLRDPVRSVVEAHAEMAERRGIALSSAVPGEPVSLRFDRERIVQLVNNLVVNALKFTSRGGHVQVDVRDAAGEAIIEVRDTGPGIPEAELPRIFERFYRGTNVGEARASGSGLGLAIARSIAEMHWGSIEVASVVAEGSVFSVHLPRIADRGPVEVSERPSRSGRVPVLRRPRGLRRRRSAPSTSAERR